MFLAAIPAQGAIVRDARLVELEKKFNATRTELRKLTVQIWQMTQPDKPMAERKKYAETMLKLRQRLMSIKRQMEKRPDPVLRLVQVIGPASRNLSREGISIRFRNPEPGYSAKIIRGFGDSNGSWTVTRNISIGFKLLPKDITAGHPFGFQIEAKLREAYPRGFICSGKQGKYPLSVGLRSIYENISVQSNQSADSSCDPGAICKNIGGRQVCRMGYLDQDSGVMLRLRYELESAKAESDGTLFRYKVDSFTDGKRTGEEKNLLIKLIVPELGEVFGGGQAERFPNHSEVFGN